MSEYLLLTGCGQRSDDSLLLKYGSEIKYRDRHPVDLKTTQAASRVYM